MGGGWTGTYADDPTMAESAKVTRSVRVAQVTATFPPYWGGTGNVAYQTARLLHDRGHEVTVVTTNRPGPDLVFPFPVTRLSPLFGIGNASITPALLKHLKGFDIIHLHYPHIFGAELTLAAARRFQTPLVVTYHNDLLAGGLRGLAFRAYTEFSQRTVLRHVSRLIATSRDYAQHSQLARAGRLPTISIIPNGVDTELFRPSTAQDDTATDVWGFPRHTGLALFVGGLDKAHHFKGVEVLIDAVARVPDLVAVVVGEGELRRSYEDMAHRLAPGQVHFTGRLAVEDLVKLYQLADFTVLPSVNRGEAFGMVLIESMACGTPVIATDLPGVRTVVDNEVDGIIVPPRDAEALAVAVAKLMANRKRTQEMGAAGRNKVVHRYRWKLVGDQLDAVYRQVVSTQ